jgi:hypothetical protein
MRSCIFVFYIALFVRPTSPGVDARDAQAVDTDPDLLDRGRSDPARGRAAAIGELRLAANPRDPEWEPEDRDFKTDAAERLSASGHR